MLFGAPIWLLAAAAGAAPLIIHLLNRQRFKRVTWAAMTFLLKALEKNRKRMRLENLLLLLLRVGVLALLAAAFAQPFLGKDNPLGLGRGPRVCRVFLLDDSYSMGHEWAGTAAFERARQIGLTVLGGSSAGDWAMAVTASGPEAFSTPTTNLANVRGALEKAELSSTGADLSAMLTKVCETIAGGTYPRVEIYVLTDYQRGAWLDEGVLRDKDLPQALERLPENVAVFLVDGSGGQERPNVAVTAVEVSAGGRESSQRLVARDTAVNVWGTVRNFGRQPVENLSMRLLVDGRVEGRKSVSAGAGESVDVEFSGVVFTGSGFHTVEVECDHDGLQVDDRRALSVDVRDEVRALCVNGRPSADLVSNETYYLERSLSPQQYEFVQGLSVFSTLTVTDVEFLQTSLGDYDLVALANVFQVPSEKAKVLERYVEGGGGLLVFLGDRVEPGAYDELLYARGKGLLPAQLLQPRVSPESDGKFVHFDVRNVTHPVMRALAQENVDLGQPRTWGYFDLNVDEESPDVKVLCRYDDETGTPAMVEKRYGAGRVMLVNGSADPRWSTFASGPFFPLFVQEAARHLVKGSLEEGNLQVGEPLEEALYPGEFGQRLTVTDPRGEVIPVLPEPTGETYLFRYAGTNQTGLYEVEFGGTRGRATYAVNLDTRESDLERFAPSELESVTGFKRLVMVTEPGELGGKVELTRTSRPIWRELLYVALGMLLLESVLAQRFGSRTGVVRKRR